MSRLNLATHQVSLMGVSINEAQQQLFTEISGLRYRILFNWLCSFGVTHQVGINLIRFPDP